MTEPGAALQPGPCVRCGRTNYPLSLGGPMMCPACDCGLTDMQQMQKRNTELTKAFVEADRTIAELMEANANDGLDLMEEVGKRKQAEAENAKLRRYLTAGRDEWKLNVKALEQAEAKVARLKWRRCDNCIHQGAVAYRDTPHPTCSCNLDARWNELDFACNRWAERGGGK